MHRVTEPSKTFHVRRYQWSFGRAVGSGVADCRSLFFFSSFEAASYLSEVILLNHPQKQTAYEAPNNFITTYIKTKLWWCSDLWVTWKPSASRCAAFPFSTRLFDLQSLPASVFFFFFFSSPLCFFALSSLNLSTSCCSYASPVFCSAVLITVLFSCQETEYDEDV